MIWINPFHFPKNSYNINVQERRKLWQKIILKMMQLHLETLTLHSGIQMYVVKQN